MARTDARLVRSPAELGAVQAQERDAMMGLTALNPGLLIAGSICVAIPILVHLLRRKHRPISWGAMRFLEQAYRKRRRLITIEQLLLLLTRCAVVAFIAGAVGSLALGSGASDQQARTMVITLDNSIHSATNLNNGQTWIEYQRSRAMDLLSSIDPTRGDTAALITLAGPAEGIGTPATNELGLIRERINSVEPSDAERDVQGAFSLIGEEILRTQSSGVVDPVLFLSPAGWNRSDQHNDMDLDGIETLYIDTGESSNETNVSISDMAPLRPLVTQSDADPSSSGSTDEIQGVKIELSRNGPLSELSSTVHIENAHSSLRIATQQIRWANGQARGTHTIPINPALLNPAQGGSVVLRAVLDEADANLRDSTRTLSIPIRSEIRVGIIDTFTESAQHAIPASKWIRAVLGAADEFVTLQQINTSSVSERIDPNLDVLFLLSPDKLDGQGWDRVIRLNTGGMPVVITPGAHDTSLDWEEYMNRLAPGLVGDGLGIVEFESPIGLAAQLPATSVIDGSLLDGIRDEYPGISASVNVSRALSVSVGDRAQTLLDDSKGNALIVALDHHAQRASEGREFQAGTVILIGVSFESNWTDLPARPLFVALTHELIRSLVAQSNSSIELTAGRSAATIDDRQLRTLDAQAQTKLNPSLAGVYSRVNSHGSTTQTVILNPDTANTTLVQSDAAPPHLVFADALPETRVSELNEHQDLTSWLIAEDHKPGRSISLFLFCGALGLGLVELVLARRCSYSAINSGNALRGAS